MTLTCYLLFGVLVQAVFYYREKDGYLDYLHRKYEGVHSQEICQAITAFTYLSFSVIWPLSIFNRMRDNLHFRFGRILVSFGIPFDSFGVGIVYSRDYGGGVVIFLLPLVITITVFSKKDLVDMGLK